MLVSALIAVELGGAWVGAVTAARHRAQAAADMAVLAAAARLPSGDQAACLQARAVAAAMRATLRDCRIERLDVSATVTVRTGLRIGPEAGASARAGPG